MDAPTTEETPDKAAQYIASMTQELAELARRNGLETLSQILEMARLEADQLIKRYGSAWPGRRLDERFCLIVALLPHSVNVLGL